MRLCDRRRTVFFVFDAQQQPRQKKHRIVTHGSISTSLNFFVDKTELNACAARSFNTLTQRYYFRRQQSWIHCWTATTPD